MYIQSQNDTIVNNCHTYVGTGVVVGCSGGDNSKRIEETTCVQVDTSERSKLTTTPKITPHRQGKWAGRLRRHEKVEDRLAEDD